MLVGNKASTVKSADTKVQVLLRCVGEQQYRDFVSPLVYS